MGKLETSFLNNASFFNASLRRIRCAAGSTSGGETGAALATARGEDRPAGTSAHALAEAVHLGATAVVRLKGPLAHGSTPAWMIGTVRRGDRGTVAHVGCPMDRDVTPRERPHHNTAGNSGRSNQLQRPPVRTRPRPGLGPASTRPGRTGTGARAHRDPIGPRVRPPVDNDIAVIQQCSAVFPHAVRERRPPAVAVS